MTQLTFSINAFILQHIKFTNKKIKGPSLMYSLKATDKICIILLIWINGIVFKTCFQCKLSKKNINKGLVFNPKNDTIKKVRGASLILLQISNRIWYVSYGLYELMV